MTGDVHVHVRYLSPVTLSYCIKPVSLESARCEGSGQKFVSDFPKLANYGLTQVLKTLLCKAQDATPLVAVANLTSPKRFVCQTNRNPSSNKPNDCI
ncbi:hypothetical protein [Vibrio bathopelagicus]|uniref:hypothetical protein n=1 Tax=Vibrio bathopelagicus TaxID=2777577 RepID=UPI00186551BB|nr:hypothetical protein [Vibrio bathopelagicus]